MGTASADIPVEVLRTRYPELFQKSLAKRFAPLLVLAGVLLYCLYAVWFFNIPTVIATAHWGRAGLYLSQWISYDVIPEFRFHEGKVETRWSRFNVLGDNPHPAWIVAKDDGSVAVDILGPGNGLVIAPHAVTVLHDGETATFDVSGDVPKPRGALPSWASVDEDQISVRWGYWGAADIGTDRVRVVKKFLGWANFVFDTSSPFFGKSPVEVLKLVFFGARIDPERSNLAFAFDNVWNNADWQHGDVWTKLFQTIVMAFAGTLMAALAAFPLSFLAARNITHNRLVNQGFKRFFDFQRSVDMLIWALFFTRAFGPGPLSGIGAIFFTETGTLGKLYSEALENLDDKPPEGVRSVGASPLLIQRYGVLPQVFPVFASQTLYFWESNTRSATIIGAVGAGGIGLKLWEAMETNSNWANVFYMVILILIVVYLFDNVSNRLRRRLIGDLPM